MGMAASQASLLSITSRMHSCEQRSQAIENAKVLLATQQDEAYADYMSKLDAKKIQIRVKPDGITNKYIDANFTNMCTYNDVVKQQFALRDAGTGKVVVPAEIYDLYKNKGFNNDRYAFAWAVLGLQNNASWAENFEDRNQGPKIGIKNNVCMTDVEQEVFNIHKDGESVDQELVNLYGEITSAGDNNLEKRQALTKFRKYLYEKYGSEIYDYMILDKSNPENKNKDGQKVSQYVNNDFESIKDKFNYYVQLFDEIKNAGGCVSLSSVCEDGNADNDWINTNVANGNLLIDMYNENTKEWTSTSVATCTEDNYLQETENKDGVDKAEAEYEHELDVINRKDKRFDKELNKLESERTALKTEMEAIKQVKDDNIERTFGIFS